MGAETLLNMVDCSRVLFNSVQDTILNVYTPLIAKILKISNDIFIFVVHHLL